VRKRVGHVQQGPKPPSAIVSPRLLEGFFKVLVQGAHVAVDGLPFHQHVPRLTRTQVRDGWQTQRGKHRLTEPRKAAHVYANTREKTTRQECELGDRTVTLNEGDAHRNAGA